MSSGRLPLSVKSRTHDVHAQLAAFGARRVDRAGDIPDGIDVADALDGADIVDERFGHFGRQARGHVLVHQRE